MHIIRGVTYLSCIFALIAPTVAICIFIGQAAEPREIEVAAYSFMLGLLTFFMAGILEKLEREVNK